MGLHPGRADRLEPFWVYQRSTGDDLVDWTYGQHNFPETSLIAILGWLGKDDWELVSMTEHYHFEDEQQRTGYLRRPTSATPDSATA